MRTSALPPEQVIYVAGHRGLVGSALLRCLRRAGFSNLLTRAHEELELTDQRAVRSFFSSQRIDYVVLAAAKVGGIHSNDTYPAEFIYDNLLIQANVIHEASCAGIKRLLFLGSSCVYPRNASQPLSEEALFTGSLEPTTEPYATAKICGIKMCESYNRQYGSQFRSVMTPNLYGPNDNFTPEHSRVIPALMRRFHVAQMASGQRIMAGPAAASSSVTVWGTGRAYREFLHVDDLAEACVFLMGLDDETYARHCSPRLSHVNVGAGHDIRISDLARMIADVTGFEGEVRFDTSKPDGAHRRVLDISRIKALGWSPRITLSEGLQSTYQWLLQNQALFGATQSQEVIQTQTGNPNLYPFVRTNQGPRPSLSS